MNRLTSALVVFAVVAAAAAANVAVRDPTKPVWPTNFDIPFGLTDVKHHYNNVSSHFYYNWEYTESLIDYPNGCLPAITTKPCQLLFNNDPGFNKAGTWLLAPEAGKPCCLLFKNIGPIPPNFLAPFNFSEVTTAKNMYGEEKSVNMWKGPMGFEYWTDAATGLDVQFRDGPLPVFWNFGKPNVRQQKVFEKPDKCSVSCLLREEGEDPELHENLKNLKPEHVQLPLPRV